MAKIAVYTICHNEEILLPFFVRHYSWAEEIVIIDNDSTDESLSKVSHIPNVIVRSVRSDKALGEALLTDVKNACWKSRRGSGYDYVAIVDCDEFLWGKEILHFFDQCILQEVTIIQPVGIDMVGDFVPNAESPLCQSIVSGFSNPFYSKPCIFAPNSISDINFQPGSHRCSPVGLVNLLRTEEIRLMHFRYLSEEFFLNRSKLRRARRNENDIRKKWGMHYDKSDQEFREEYRLAKLRSRRIV
jgi:glycosyltransferase involved in cell wall biosynthesis